MRDSVGDGDVDSRTGFDADGEESEVAGFDTTTMKVVPSLVVKVGDSEPVTVGVPVRGISVVTGELVVNALSDIVGSGVVDGRVVVTGVSVWDGGSVVIGLKVRVTRLVSDPDTPVTTMVVRWSDEGEEVGGDEGGSVVVITDVPDPDVIVDVITSAVEDVGEEDVGEEGVSEEGVVITVVLGVVMTEGLVTLSVLVVALVVQSERVE